MTARSGETFELGRAVRDVEALLAGPVPTTGPTDSQGDPVTGEWTATSGEGFRILPLWESDSLVGVYAPEWNDAEEAARGHLDDLEPPAAPDPSGPVLWLNPELGMSAGKEMA
ncbi:hypothetical protein ACWD8C_30280, partial [Streptomyces sp. NPDC005166]